MAVVFGRLMLAADHTRKIQDAYSLTLYDRPYEPQPWLRAYRSWRFS